MEKFIVIALCFALAIVIGVNFLTGPTNSVQSGLTTVMTNTATKIKDVGK